MNLLGCVNEDNKSVDMVQICPFGDDRWYLGYVTSWHKNNLTVTTYTIEGDKLVPTSYGVDLDKHQERCGLIW